MKNVILQGEKITRTFHQGKTEIKVLDGIDIKIFEKDFTVIMGPSGAGKSTLLYMLGGMDHITGGRVLYRDKEISSFSEKRMGRLRAEEFGFVFQQTHLVSSLTLLENVLVAGYVSKKDSAEKVRRGRKISCGRWMWRKQKTDCHPRYPGVRHKGQLSPEL